MHTLSKDHPARCVVGAARIVRRALLGHRLFATVGYTKLQEQDGQTLQALCIETATDADRLRTLMQSHAADGVITGEELDEQLKVLNEIQAQALEGRVIR